MDLVQERFENIDRERVLNRLHEMRRSIMNQVDQDCIAIIVEEDDLDILWDAISLIKETN